MLHSIFHVVISASITCGPIDLAWSGTKAKRYTSGLGTRVQCAVKFRGWKTNIELRREDIGMMMMMEVSVSGQCRVGDTAKGGMSYLRMIQFAHITIASALHCLVHQIWLIYHLILYLNGEIARASGTWLYQALPQPITT